VQIGLATGLLGLLGQLRGAGLGSRGALLGPGHQLPRRGLCCGVTLGLLTPGALWLDLLALGTLWLGLLTPGALWLNLLTPGAFWLDLLALGTLWLGLLTPGAFWLNLLALGTLWLDLLTPGSLSLGLLVAGGELDLELPLVLGALGLGLLPEPLHLRARLIRGVCLYGKAVC
jgi:hypothetical protein